MMRSFYLAILAALWLYGPGLERASAQVTWPESQITGLADCRPDQVDMLIISIFKEQFLYQEFVEQNIGNEERITSSDIYQGILFAPRLSSSITQSNYSPTVGVICAFILEAWRTGNLFHAWAPYPLKTEDVTALQILPGQDPTETLERALPLEREITAKYADWLKRSSPQRRQTDPLAGVGIHWFGAPSR